MMEPVVYLALFLLVALLGLGVRWLKAQIEEPPTEAVEAGPWTGPHRPAKVISAASPATTGDAARAPRQAPAAQLSRLRRRPPARLAAGGRVRDLRRGIMWMTILGRCRGLDQPGRVATTGPHLEPPP